MTFGATLVAMRTRRGISQTTMAGLAGYEHSYAARLEAGTRHPSRETVTALADALRLDDMDRARLLIAALYWPGDAAARAYLTAVGVGA